MRSGVLLAVWLAVAPAAAWAQPAEASVPAPLALVVMLRVLTYDAAFATHGGDDFVVLLSGKPGDASDKVLADLTGMAQTKLAGRLLKVERVAPDTLEAAVVQKKAGAVLVLATDAGGVAAGLKAAQKGNAYTLAFAEEALRHGVMLGVGNKDGRPQPLLNPAALKAASVALPQSVLKVARLVQ